MASSFVHLHLHTQFSLLDGANQIEPLIQQITAMQEKGIDLNWQRVYKFADTAHVKFNHAPHVRANVDCATCHGNIGGGTVAQVNVKLSMGFCVNCHNEKKAPVDCLTCHF